MINETATRILLLGAGELGTAILTSLRSLPNTHITIGVRTPSNYPHLVTSNSDLTTLDTTSPSEALAEEFACYDILISATGFGQDLGTVTKLAKEALLAGEIKKSRSRSRDRGEKSSSGKLWFFPWQWGVDYDVTDDGQGLMPLFGEQKAVRDLLRAHADESNVKWTVVSTGIFMSFLFEQFWGIVDRTHEEDGKVVVRALRDWEHQVTVTDVHDIGRVLARIVAGDVDADNQVVYVAGDTVSYGRLAEIVARSTGKEIAKEQWSIPSMEEELSKDPTDGIKKYRLVFARDGVWWDKSKSVNAKLGMEMLTVEDYANKVFNDQ